MLKNIIHWGYFLKFSRHFRPSDILLRYVCRINFLLSVLSSITNLNNHHVYIFPSSFYSKPSPFASISPSIWVKPTQLPCWLVHFFFVPHLHNFSPTSSKTDALQLLKGFYLFCLHPAQQTNLPLSPSCSVILQLNHHLKVLLIFLWPSQLGPKRKVMYRVTQS